MEKEMQGTEIPLTETGQNGQLGGPDSHTDPPLPNTPMERLLSTREVFFEEPIQSFFGLLQSDPFRAMARALPGYDVSQAGKIVFPENR